MFICAIHESSFRQILEKVFVSFYDPASSAHNIVTYLPPVISTQMNDNQIDNWSDLDELKNAKSLETVYLERNPLQKDPQYRRKIMLALPTVRQIDATFIRFWGANVQFSCWLQCSLLPPCLPYLRKKKKEEAYVILNTHLPHRVVQPLRTQTCIPTLNLPTAYLTYMCALTHTTLLFIRLENCTQTPRTVYLSVFCYLLLVSVLFLFFYCLHAADWIKTQWH